MQRVLIVGVDTVLGSNLALEFARWFDVRGLFEQIAVEIDGCPTEMQPNGSDALLARIDQLVPTWVIHCGSISQSCWNGVDTSPNDADVARTLLVGSRQIGYRLCVISSDAVFTGPRMFHLEEAPRLGNSTQARQARHVERLLRDSEALVVRTHAYGWSPAPELVPGIERLWETLRFSSECRLETMRHATPILASDLAWFLSRAVDRELAGVFHIAGAERTNPYRFGMELAAVFGLPSNHVRCQSADHDGSMSPVREEMSLATHRIRRALNRAMPLLRDGLYRLAEQAEQGLPSRFRAAEPIPAAA